MDSLDGVTRAWMMGQGHCVAAIDALNVLVGNMTDRHAERYDRTDEGLSRFVSDFYAYTLNPDGTPASPLGSHVNAHTAGGVMEGGYLGFRSEEHTSELQSLMRISYAVFCLKKKTKPRKQQHTKYRSTPHIH